MTTVKTVVGFKLTDLTTDFNPNFYAHNDDGAYATINIEGKPGLVLGIYGDFKYQGNVPTGGDVDGLEIGVFNAAGKYTPLISFRDVPDGIDVGALAKAALSGDPQKLEAVIAKIFGGEDLFAGSKQDDEFSGFKGNDELNGGKGDDTLDGGAGKDTIDCGPKGEDHVVFSVFDKKADTILNFDGNDVLDFKAGAFKGLEAVDGHLDETMFHVGKKAADANDFIVFDDKSGKLFYDADGDGDGKQILIAKLGKGVDLDADHINLF